MTNAYHGSAERSWSLFQQYRSTQCNEATNSGEIKSFKDITHNIQASRQSELNANDGEVITEILNDIAGVGIRAE